jgi:hypothetical protein
MLVAGRYKVQGLALTIPDILHELQCDVHSPVLACSHLCLLKDTANSQAHLHVLQNDSVHFSQVTVSILLRPESSKMEGSPHTAGIVLDFLKETSRNRELSDFLMFVVEVLSGHLCHLTYTKVTFPTGISQG